MATTTFAWQTWNSGPFSIERGEGKARGTVIFRMRGPFTTRDVYTCLPPTALREILESESAPGEARPAKHILDLTACPYMDSSGIGMVATHFVHCRNRGVKMICVGPSPRVLEVLKITNMHTIIPMAATIEEAEAA